MNKQDLIAKIAKDTGSSKAGAAAAVDSLIDGITKSLKKGDSITFVGFGTFKTAQRKARTARNPQTGAAIKIPKRRVVRFTAGKALKEPSADAHSSANCDVQAANHGSMVPSLRAAPLPFSALPSHAFCYTDRSFYA